MIEVLELIFNIEKYWIHFIHISYTKVIRKKIGMTIDEKYMARCIQLAKNGRCNVSPNPMVGAVIVCDGKIIGEGYHIKYGGPHAEVNAISSVKEQQKLENSTIYVSLEPCSHYGKTPPCADLIISKKIPRVIIGCKDPFPLVSGRGIKKLTDAGVDVKWGVLERECLDLNKKFILFNTQKRPYITLKWAQSADGFIDIKRESGESVKISSDLTRMLVHKYRSENMAIMVGTNTARLDNPTLSTRDWYGKNPTRIVIDRKLALPKELHLFDGKVNTIVFNSIKDGDSNGLTLKKIDFNSEVIPQILDILYNEKLESVIIEGGAILLQSFIDKDLWDEAFIEISDLVINDGVKAPEIKKFNKRENMRRFNRKIMHLTNR